MPRTKPRPIDLAAFPPRPGNRCILASDAECEFGRDDDAPDKWAVWLGGEWRAIDGDPRAQPGARFTITRHHPEGAREYLSNERRWRIRCGWCGAYAGRSWAADDYEGAWRADLVPICGGTPACPEGDPYRARCGARS